MTIVLGFEIIDQALVPVTIPDEKIEGMTYEDIAKYAQEMYGGYARQKAIETCPYDIGWLEGCQIYNGEEKYLYEY